MDGPNKSDITENLRRLHPSDVFNYERFSDEGNLIECGQTPIGLDSHCAADLIEQLRAEAELLKVERDALIMSEENKQTRGHYKIVSRVDPVSLQRHVNANLEAGFDLLGAPFVCVDGVWHQAMTYCGGDK